VRILPVLLLPPTTAFKKSTWKIMTKAITKPTSVNSINTPNSPPKFSSTPYSTCKCQQHTFNSMIWHATQIIKILPLNSEFLGVSHSIPQKISNAVYLCKYLQ